MDIGDLRKNLGEHYYKRCGRPLSQYQLADLLRVSQSTVNRWERGLTRPNGPTRQVLEDYRNGARKVPEGFFERDPWLVGGG